MEEARKLPRTSVSIFLNSRIAVIGAGSVGSQVIDALHSKGHRDIIATRTTEENLEDISNRYGINTTTDNGYAAQNSDIIVLAVKPDDVKKAAQQINGYANNKLVISLAAARSIDYIEELVGTRVSRVMTGVFVKDEVAAYTLGEESEKDRATIQYIFGSNAKEVDENLLADRTFIA
ncbi:NAD(P)-binding domain-containing protein, partial [Candidatus Woesearchaeota archaeon]|nr:NAD(P)-binding domain-containing protein [Candidatus Woesearchaeota archaeon]